MLFSPLASQSARHPDADIVLVEGVLAPAEPGERMLVAPYHIHRLDDEIFYILSGQVGFEVGNDTYSTRPGDAVIVPRGAIHTWWNEAPVAARYLLVMPKKLDDLIIAVHSGSYGPDAMSALYDGYDTTYIGWTR